MVYPHIQYRGPGYPDLEPSTPSTISAGTRELDSRISDGIRIRLLWHPDDGHVSVSVEETKSGVIFDLPVRDGERALDVFHHPYAYAAIRRFGNNADDEARLRVHAAPGAGPR
jgi:hypothetical protein